MLSSLPWYDIASLRHPQRVLSWDSTGLVAARSGRISLPVSSISRFPPGAIDAVTARGIEADSTGKVYALVQIHRWCGNDALQHQVVRVELHRFVAYLTMLAEARSTRRLIPSTDELWARPSSRMFNQFGWRAEVYADFKYWEREGYSTLVLPPAAVASIR